MDLISSFPAWYVDSGIIPRPLDLCPGSGRFNLDGNTAILWDRSAPQLEEMAVYLNEMIFAGVEGRTAVQAVDMPPDIKPDPVQNAIILTCRPDPDLGREGYRLCVRPEGITIAAPFSAGVFYGIQTLRQLLPVTEVGGGQQIELSIPCVEITDSPCYRWRGMMLDVSRHFQPVSFIKQFIDYLALYKFNTFHWHLVDDQGWRIEIKKYPKLTAVGAWRVDREESHWNSRGPQQPGEVASYGGFYTQDKIKEIVAYAARRQVTIVPEIEMPAHVVSSLAAYPEHSCTGGPFAVLPGGYWPISDIYCAGNERTFDFLEDVLTEVMVLFPGKYIHIGGDEADKTNWRRCEKCQARIAAEGLADENELQSYFIKRIERKLAAAGRRLIGWDEILEGGLAPGALVMSWRGAQGGIAAARAGHDVVMTPTAFCYFDYYQGQPGTEPPAIGGWLPLSRVYEFEPTPAESLSLSEQEHILGAQGNLWSEYIPSPAQAEYMILPRICAMAEVVWTRADRRDWDNFSDRMQSHFRRLWLMGANYAESAMAVQAEVSAAGNGTELVAVLRSELDWVKIYFTLDGSAPSLNSSLYHEPIRLQDSATLRARSFWEERPVGQEVLLNLLFHKAAAKPVNFTHANSDRYNGGGPDGLTNLLRGSMFHADGKWTGFEEVDMQATVDLGESVGISRISCGFLQIVHSWIFLPVSVLFEISEDGEEFTLVDEVAHNVALDEGAPTVKEIGIEFEQRPARFVRITARNIGQNPNDHYAAGGRSWVFADEIVVE